MALTAKQKRDERDAQLRAEGAAQARAEIEAQRAKDLPPDHDIRGPVSAAVAAANLAAAINPGGVRSAHGDTATPQHAGGKVIVGCKLGISYFDLQLCSLVTKDEQSMSGMRTIKEAIRIGEIVRLRGTAYPRGTPPAGFPERPEIVAGASLNRGVDRDFMVEWLKQNHLNPVVVNKLVFIHDNDDGIKGLANEFAGIRSGLEPINPSDKSDSRVSRFAKSNNPAVEEIQPGVRPKQEA